MATAVEPSSAPSAPGKPTSLVFASLLGAIYVLAALAVVIYTVPLLIKDGVSENGVPIDMSLPRVLVQLAVFAGLVWFGSRLAGTPATPKGVRGGAFLMAVALLLIFYVTRGFAVYFEGVAGQVLSIVIGVALLFFTVKLFTGQTGERWMVALEEQGWFSTHQYKRSLGLRVRRLTILGILLIGATGVYSMIYQGFLPNQWTLSMPGEMAAVTVLNDAKVFVPLAIIVLTLWVAWRAVNVPTFAEFLIATEAEMNKVSWSSRKRLMQDTVVVLITTLIMTLFLLVVDLFWGWLLSRQTVGVLPGKPTAADKDKGGVRDAKW